MLPPNILDRSTLANEVHARPAQPIRTPSHVTQLALLVDREQRAAELAHVCALCTLWGLDCPPTDAIYFVMSSPSIVLRWERHGEFSSYTFIAGGCADPPFADSPIEKLPSGWLSQVPGQVLAATHALALPPQVEPADLTPFFGDNVPVGAEIGDGAAKAFSDFRLHADGFSRVVILDHHLTARQAGRMMQRFFEIENYRMLALLALPIARKLWPQITQMEQELILLSQDVAVIGTDDGLLLDRLTKFASEIEHELSNAQGRFAASRAYKDLVQTRVSELRERRLPGYQPMGEFMAHRFIPATQTIASAERRLRDLSERTSRVSTLLSTRVDIAREQQNQRLLLSLDRRVEVQLRLQQAVEGLSVAAIVYYGAGLTADLARVLQSFGVRVDVDVVVGISIPIIAAICLWALRRAHRHLQ